MRAGLHSVTRRRRNTEYVTDGSSELPRAQGRETWAHGFAAPPTIKARLLATPTSSPPVSFAGTDVEFSEPALTQA